MTPMVSRVTAVVPFRIAGQRTSMLQIEVNGRRSAAVLLGVLDTRPGLFTADGSGTGQARALNEDGSPNSGASPAFRGSIISLLATGAGVSDEAGAPILPVRVQIGGQDAEVLYAGAADGQAAGVLRIDVRIPDGAAAGDVPARVFFGYTPSPAGTTISVQ